MHGKSRQQDRASQLSSLRDFSLPTWDRGWTGQHSEDGGVGVVKGHRVHWTELGQVVLQGDEVAECGGMGGGARAHTLGLACIQMPVCNTVHGQRGATNPTTPSSLDRAL